MKWKLIFVLMVLLINAFVAAHAQSPQQFNYQAVARGANGQPLANTNIKARLSIRHNNADGSIVYSETRDITTNAFGLFSIAVGSGGAGSVTGNFSQIDWAGGGKFLQTEIQLPQTNQFLNMGTTQIMSVPYALQSENTLKLQGRPVSGAAPANGQVLKWNGNTWAAGDDQVGGQGNFFLPYAGALNNGSTLFKVNNTGTGAAIEASATGGTALNAFTQGNGNAILASADNGAGVFSIVNGAGTAISGLSQSGIAGRFEVSNTASSADAVVISQKGNGRALNINYNNANSSTNGVLINYNGKGSALKALASADDAVAVYGQAGVNGTYSVAARFENMMNNIQPAVQVFTKGNGFGIEVKSDHPSIGRGIYIDVGDNGGTALDLSSGNLRLGAITDPADLTKVIRPLIIFDNKSGTFELPKLGEGAMVLVLNLGSLLNIKTAKGEMPVPYGSAKWFVFGGQFDEFGWHPVN